MRPQRLILSQYRTRSTTTGRASPTTTTRAPSPRRSNPSGVWASRPTPGPQVARWRPG